MIPDSAEYRRYWQQQHEIDALADRITRLEENMSNQKVFVSRYAVELAVKALEVQGKLFEQNGIHPSSLIAWWNQEHIDELRTALTETTEEREEPS